MAVHYSDDDKKLNRDMKLFGVFIILVIALVVASYA
jgi:hypothetical protein